MLPALLIAYNRPEHTARVMASMREAGIREVFVALDGPSSGSQEMCDRTRAVVESATWPERKTIRESDVNQGPGWGPRNAIDWFFSHVPRGIICEDDTLLGSDAAEFLTQAAHDFREDVPMAAATSLGAVAYLGGSSYFTSRYATTWGWAVDAHTWSAYDYSIADWPERRSTDWLIRIGGSRDFARYWTNVFDMTYADRDHYWDYQWQYAMWKNNWLCWHPRVNLVTNIGFDEAATHTHVERRGLTHLPAHRLPAPLVTPISTEPDDRVDRWIGRNVYRIKRSLRGRLYRAIFRRKE